MTNPTEAKGGAKLPADVLERMADAAATPFGWSYLNLEEGDPENPNGRRGYHDPEGDPTKLYFRTIAQAAWEASPGPGLVERLQAIIDWADFALANPAEFDSHGVRNLDGPVFDEGRLALSALSPTEPNTPADVTERGRG